MGVRVDPHRRTGSDVLDEDLVRRVLVNPHGTILEENREALVPELVLRLCRRVLCHLAPPLAVWGWGFLRHNNRENRISRLLCRRKIGQNSQGAVFFTSLSISYSMIYVNSNK